MRSSDHLPKRRAREPEVAEGRPGMQEVAAGANLEAAAARREETDHAAQTMKSSEAWEAPKNPRRFRATIKIYYIARYVAQARNSQQIQEG